MQGTATIRIVDVAINVQEVIDAVRDPAAGAIDVFIGTTRNNAGGKVVAALEYDAYVPMALELMEKIAAAVAAEFGVGRIAVVHRIGRVGIGEESVVIAVSSAHRKEAFAACRAMIDRLKQEVPIWKKEFFSDGEKWVGEPS
jgi:molybdopterin synthase catalytic subunit